MNMNECNPLTIKKQLAHISDIVTHIFQWVQFPLALVSGGLGSRIVVLPLLLLTTLFICNLKSMQRV